MNPITAIIEILLIASGLFFLGLALADGRRATRRAAEPDVAHPSGVREPATVLPRTIRRTALD